MEFQSRFRVQKNQIKKNQIKEKDQFEEPWMCEAGPKLSLDPQLPSSTMAVVEANAVVPRRVWRSTSLGLNYFMWYSRNVQHLDGRNTCFEMGSPPTFIRRTHGSPLWLRAGDHSMD